MELDLAGSMCHGSEAQKEKAFQSMFPQMITEYHFVSSCIKDESGLQSDSTLLGNFEQLAGEVLPGVKWSSVNCLQSVEHELKKLKLDSLIGSWGSSLREILSTLRAHFKQERIVSNQGKAFNAVGAADSDKGPGLNSASGLKASRTPDFLLTKQQVASCSNFMDVLDTLLQSQSKPWFLKGIRQLNKHPAIEEMETCSKFLNDWDKYWPMAISRDDSGTIHEAVQGESFPEEQVEHLLKGDCHLVDWIILCQLMDKWMDGVEPEEDMSYSQYTTLCSVKSLMVKTMKVLGLAHAGDSEDDPCTCVGFMNKVIRLQRRSRAIKQGSKARAISEQNVQDVFMKGLKEFGARWSRQWLKPVNYSEPIVRTFAETGCFVMKRFDKLDKVADQVYDFQDVLPGLVNMEMLGSPAGQAAPLYQKPNRPYGEMINTRLRATLPRSCIPLRCGWCRKEW